MIGCLVKDNSIKGEDFAQFLKEVRGASQGGETIHLFLDNARHHHSKEHVKDLWAELNIEPVWNVPYSPQYNTAIERFWAQLKSAFRPLLLQKLLLGKKVGKCL